MSLRTEARSQKSEARIKNLKIIHQEYIRHGGSKERARAQSKRLFRQRTLTAENTKDAMKR